MHMFSYICLLIFFAVFLSVVLCHALPCFSLSLPPLLAKTGNKLVGLLQLCNFTRHSKEAFLQTDFAVQYQIPSLRKTNFYKNSW